MARDATAALVPHVLPRVTIKPMTDDTMTDAGLDAELAELERAGLVEQYTDEEGKAAMRLTEKGPQLGRSMAMAGNEDAAVVLDALLEGES